MTIESISQDVEWFNISIKKFAIVATDRTAVDSGAVTGGKLLRKCPLQMRHLLAEQS